MSRYVHTLAVEVDVLVLDNSSNLFCRYGNRAVTGAIKQKINRLRSQESVAQTMKKVFDVYLSIKDSIEPERISGEFKKAGFKVVGPSSDLTTTYIDKKTKKAINESRIVVAFLSKGFRDAAYDLRYAYDTRAEIVIVLLDKLDKTSDEDDSDNLLSRIVRASITYNFQGSTHAPTSKQLNFLFSGLVNILGYQVRFYMP